MNYFGTFMIGMASGITFTLGIMAFLAGIMALKKGWNE